PYFDDAEKQPGTGATPARTQLSASQSTRRNLPFAQDLSGVYFAPLGGTKIEADAIRALFPRASLLTGTQATKAALLKLEAPSILHIATHGFFLEDQTSNNGKAGAADGTRAATGSDDVENPLLRSGLALSGANVNRRGRERGILTALEAANLNLWGTK